VSSAHNVWLDGSTLYIANSQSRLIHIWDVSDGAAPRAVSTIGALGGCAHDMYVAGGVLYGAFYRCPGGGAELLVASVANPASPAALAHVSYAGAQLTHSTWLSADGGYLYVADEVVNAPIRIFAVANPANPVLVGTYQPRLGTIPHQFQVRDARYAFLAHYKHGVEVVDVSDPVHPRLVGFYDTHPGEAADGTTPGPPGAGLFGGAWGVHWTDDGKIVVSDENGGVFVLRFLADP
jgi:choice-of-anchor B domain-containing protein